MALKVGELFAALSLKKDQFDKGLAGAYRSAKSTAGKLAGIFTTAALALAGVGVAAGAAAFKLGSFASDMNEARSKVNVVFEDMAGKVEAFAKTAPAALGISETAALSATGTYGNLFRSMGIGLGKSTDMSTQLLKLSSDLASFNNLDPTAVLEKLRSGLVGETEPLRSLGINLNDAMLREKALSMGLVKTTKDVLPAAAKAQAAFALIMEQSTLAQGDFARTAGGMANQQRILAATFETTMAGLGQAFIPIIQSVLPMLTGALQDFSVWVTANAPAIAEIIKGVMAGIGAAIAFVTDTGIPALAAAFRWVIDNVVPIFTAGIDTIGGPSGVMKTLGTAFAFITDTVIPAFGDVFNWIKDNILPPVQSVFETFTTVILPALGEAFAGIQQWIRDNWPLISRVVEQVAGAVKSAFELIAGVIQIVTPIIVDVGRVVFPALGAAAMALLQAMSLTFDAIGTVWQVAAEVAANTVGAIKGVWEPLSSFFTALWDGIAGTVKSSINSIITAINGFITAVNSIQIHIPGFDTPAGKVAAFDWSGLNLGQIPYLAKGTPSFRGGWAVLGEQGPELARLPRGTQVLSNADSRALTSSSNISVGDVIFNVQALSASDAEARSFARKMWGYLEEEAYRRGRPLQPVRGGS